MTARPIRVMQLVDAPRRRGAEVFAADLRCWLAGRGHSCRTVYLHAADGGRSLVEPGDVILGASPQNPVEKIAVNPNVLRRLLCAVDEFRPDILQVNGARTVKYGASARIAAQRSYWKLVYRNIGISSAWVQGTLKRTVFRRLVGPTFDGVVALTGAFLADLRSTYGFRCPAVVIPNAIRTEKLKSNDSRETARRRIGVPVDAPVACFVGALSPEKRPDRFIDVVASAGYFGLVVGDGSERGRLEASVRARGLAGRFRFLGQVDEVAASMCAADVLLSTSDTEGIPAVVLEAGWLGVPTIGFAVGGLPECVSEGTGILCPPGCLAEMVAAAASLAADPDRRTRLGAAARADVERRFSIDVVGSMFEAFWWTLLEAAPLRGDDRTLEMV